METFNDRLIFQKTVYLIQEFGIYLGYKNFSWYLRGPYSSELTKIGFELKDVYDELPQSGRFTDDDVEARFKEFLAKKKNPDKDEDAITQFLIGLKPNLSIENYEHAWNYLERYNLIDS